jgi:hypothetical protein
MRQSDERDRAEAVVNRPPPRRRTIVALGCWALLMIAVLLAKAHSSFSNPFPNWMTEAERWYDNLLGALAWASVAVACLMYLRYRAGLQRAGRAAVARPWRVRSDVRLVLYTLAATLFLQLPIGIYRSVVALSDASTPSFANSIFSVFPIGAILFPLVGCALIVYDFRRATREKRIAGNLCLRCGYDLRASTDRCPECGSASKAGHPAAA